MSEFEQRKSRPQNGHLASPPQSDREMPRLARAENPVLTQQQALGNQAAQRFARSCPLRLPSPSLCPYGGACHTCSVQAKPTEGGPLKVNKPGDKYEQDADRVADQVMRMPEPRLQRACSTCDEEPTVQTKPLADQIMPLVQRQVEPEEAESVQAKQVNGQKPRVGAGLEARIHSLRGRGQSLPRSIRSFFEPRFGYDFSRVRVHTDTYAAESAQAIHARAYTVGQHIVFSAGEYALGTEAGKRLLAHELTHIAQQGRACHLSRHIAPSSRAGVGISRSAPQMVSRTVDFAALAGEIDRGGKPRIPSTLQKRGMQFGVVGHGAKSPSKRSAAQSNVPTDGNLPIEAFFFPSPIQHTKQRALIIGGIHGTELPSYELADAMVNKLKTPAVAKTLYFHTLIIPRVNPGGIKDRRRCNRQEADLNRNFLGPSTSNKICRIPSLQWRRRHPTSCECTKPRRNFSPEQPETKLIKKVIKDFKPDRILSLHAHSKPAKAGIFADPVRDKGSRDLARTLAETLPESVRKGNRGLKTGYSGGSTGGGSLGAWAPTAVRGRTIPVITLEVPEYGSFGGRTGKRYRRGARTLAAFLRPSLGFVQDPKSLINPEDEKLLKEVRRLTSPKLKLFLTGRGGRRERRLAEKIERRVQKRVADLNAYLDRYKKGLRKAVQRKLPRLKSKSHLRLFGTPVTRRGGVTKRSAGGQGRIIFDKFFLTGRKMSHWWDSLPQEYWVNKRNRRRKCGATSVSQRLRHCQINRAKWLKESSEKRLKIILRFSAVSGASRHHWGTDVDFNSLSSEHWSPPKGRLYPLWGWLTKHAYKAGFAQVYTSGRRGGHSDKPWHWTYMPLAIPLLKMYKKTVAITKDIVDPIVRFFQRRAGAVNLRLPQDFQSAIRKINIKEYVTDIKPGL